ncbi:class D beta-lactamase [Limoniibacter endophyticus]|uniref:Penicillin-binding protein transpeptidase domain-containing protein n=1 Tax=Limoniibacter endophyticus TaxID=1565040 RepID=A0A8J3GFU1_9HYPH|nr:class D beta-lactamase [Limoniibacter endophyticus]GHC64883.1 hypothetical protein GCM10010136_07170 [Limoniibacter endophyticus]
MTALLSSFLRAGISSLAAATLVLASASYAAADTHQIELTPYRADTDHLTLSFLAHDLETGEKYVLEGSDLDTRHTPFSTFKIPNLVIALETGVAPSLDAWREWDAFERPAASHWPDVWQESQDLGTAFARSSVWYFQDLALEIGGVAYRQQLSDWGYGNAEAPDGSDDFWLTGELLISVNEQVDFLQALVSGNLGVAQSSLDALDGASEEGSFGSVTLHGKTGSGPDNPEDTSGSFSGWYTGYLSREDAAPVVFALHVAGPSFSSIRDFRKDFATRLLQDAGLTNDI